MVASCDLASSRIFTETFQERLQVSDTVATPPQDRLNFTDDSNQAILGKDTSKLSFFSADIECYFVDNLYIWQIQSSTNLNKKYNFSHLCFRYACV